MSSSLLSSLNFQVDALSAITNIASKNMKGLVLVLMQAVTFLLLHITLSIYNISHSPAIFFPILFCFLTFKTSTLSQEKIFKHTYKYTSYLFKVPVFNQYVSGGSIHNTYLA